MNAEIALGLYANYQNKILKTMTGIFTDGDDDILPDEPSQVEKIIYHAEEPLTVHEIIGRMIGKMSARETRQELEQLIEKGVVEKGPPDKPDGLKGLVEQEPTYRLAQREEIETDAR